jgi:hypothetical protein
MRAAMPSAGLHAQNFLKLSLGWAFEPKEDDAFGMLVSISKGELDAGISIQVDSKESRERQGADVREREETETEGDRREVRSAER